jgi:hypothetical protein
VRCDDCGVPGSVLGVEGVGVQAAVKDANQSVGDLAEGGVVARSASLDRAGRLDASRTGPWIFFTLHAAGTSAPGPGGVAAWRQPKGGNGAC